MFQVGDQAAEIWDRSLGPGQMTASSPDPLRILFPHNVCQSMGPGLQGETGGSSLPGYTSKLVCGPSQGDQGIGHGHRVLQSVFGSIQKERDLLKVTKD